MIETAILTEEQLKCLASPVRNEVFMALRSIGQASATDVASATGLSAETIHFHLKSLLRAELIVQNGQRPSARRPESVYESSAERYYLPEDSSLSSIVSRSVAAGLRRMVRGYEQAASQARHREKPSEGFHIIQARLSLSTEDAETFRQMIDHAAEFARKHEDKTGSTFQWTSVVYPTKPRD